MPRLVSQTATSQANLIFDAWGEKLLLVGGSESKLLLCRPLDGEEVRSFQHEDSIISSVLVHHDTLIVGADQGVVTVFDLSTGDQLQTFISGNSDVLDMKHGGEFLWVYNQKTQDSDEYPTKVHRHTTPLSQYTFACVIPDQWGHSCNMAASPSLGFFDS